MFKNAILYRINADLPESAKALQDAMEAQAFQPCGNTQRDSLGWVPPRGDDNGPLVEVVDGQWIIQLRHEQRLLPSQVVTDYAEELADKVEDETGRRPGKKAMKELKERAERELLPQAFRRRHSISAWLCPDMKLLVVDASSLGKADDLTHLLVAAVPSMNLHLLQTHQAPQGCMAAWLMDGIMPEHFTADCDGELRSADEMKSVIRYTRHTLDTDEIRQHLRAGKMPTQMAVTWKGRISLLLKDSLILSRITFLDVVFDGREKPAKDEAFDVDIALFTGEMRAMLADLIEALGGEFQLPIVAAAEGQPTTHVPAPHMPGDGPDPLYDQAVSVVVENKRASISLVQRHLRIGYNRAARLLERMADEGLVSPMRMDGTRELRDGVPA